MMRSSWTRSGKVGPPSTAGSCVHQNRISFAGQSVGSHGGLMVAHLSDGTGQ
jgi:hypothetical protein